MHWMSLDVIGRGLVLVTSIDADADPGDLVVWRGVTWRVKDVELMRNGKGVGGLRKSGLIVVGEAGSSSTLDALGATEAKNEEGNGKK